MERLKPRIDLAHRALVRLGEVVEIVNRSAIERDALVQRFEFSFEAVWKSPSAIWPSMRRFRSDRRPGSSVLAGTLDCSTTSRLKRP